MQTQLQHRLSELQQEFQKGQQKLQELEREAQGLRETMLRIAGAIQVLEEELAKADGQALPEEAGQKSAS